MNIIVESKQVGILYHCTDVRRLYNIIESNKLKAVGGEYRKPAVSLSRSKTSKPNFIVRLCIDGDKLSNNTRIYPYQDPDWDKDEMEERVDKDIKNIRNYIVNIDLNKSLVESELPTMYIEDFDQLLQFLDGYGIDYKVL